MGRRFDMRLTRRRFLKLTAAVLATPYGLTRSLPEQASSIPELRIGAVLPIPTGNPAPTDTIGEAAATGILLADDLVGREADRLGTTLRVLLASSPSVDAAVRAARRLVSTEDVAVLVGGLGEAQAQALGEVAEERGVLFFNIGSSSGALRAACRPTTFHIEASSAMYLDALAGWYSRSGHRRWYLVSEDTVEGRSLATRAAEAVAATGESRVVGRAGVARQQFVYNDVFDDIRETEPDVVLLLLVPEDQEFFLSQYQGAGLEPAITGISEPIQQTRDFTARVLQIAPIAGAGHRVALWEPTLQVGGAMEINERFGAREGLPMDPSGWAAYAAVKILFEAVAATGSVEVPELIRYLESPEAIFDAHKGVALSFRAWDHQLRQPLYLVRPDPNTVWGPTLSDKLAVTRLVGGLPALYLPDADPVERLDQLGDGPEASTCNEQ